MFRNACTRRTRRTCRVTRRARAPVSVDEQETREFVVTGTTCKILVKIRT
jgi:hypothetical protein